MARLRCISGLVVAKREGIARSPNADGAALVDRAAQQRLTQIIEQQTLQRTLHRARAKLRIKAGFGNLRDGIVIYLQRNALFG